MDALSELDTKLKDGAQSFEQKLPAQHINQKCFLASLPRVAHVHAYSNFSCWPYTLTNIKPSWFKMCCLQLQVSCQKFSRLVFYNGDL